MYSLYQMIASMSCSSYYSGNDRNNENRRKIEKSKENKEIESTRYPDVRVSKYVPNGPWVLFMEYILSFAKPEVFSKAEAERERYAIRIGHCGKRVKFRAD